MLILSLLGGANIETRLMLLSWFAFHEYSGGSSAIVPFEKIGLSKRQLATALAYLVRKGFIWKIKNFSSQSVTGARERFDYGLSTEYLQVWVDTLNNCKWWGSEVLHLLTSLDLSNKTVVEKSLIITPAMRLVWALLASRADQAGYLIGVNSQDMCKMLGMSESHFKTTVQALIKADCISIKSNDVDCTTIFAEQAPIYKIHPRWHGKKTIKMGIVLPRSIILLRFLSELKELYDYDHVPAKRRGMPPLNRSTLPYEQYRELSKYICLNDYYYWVHHFCMSIVFSKLQDYVEVRDGESNHDLDRQSRKAAHDKFFNSVKAILTEGLIRPQLSAHAQDQKKINELREYSLNQLTHQVLALISELSESWSVLSKIYCREAQPLDYLKGQQMLAKPLKELGAEVSECSDVKIFEQSHKSNQIWSVPGVLTVLVPNYDKYDDCMIIGEELLAANSRVEGVNVRQVKQLIVGQKRHFKSK